MTTGWPISSEDIMPHPKVALEEDVFHLKQGDTLFPSCTRWMPYGPVTALPTGDIYISTSIDLPNYSALTPPPPRYLSSSTFMFAWPSRWTSPLRDMYSALSDLTADLQYLQTCQPSSNRFLTASRHSPICTMSSVNSTHWGVGSGPKKRSITLNKTSPNIPNHSTISQAIRILITSATSTAEGVSPPSSFWTISIHRVGLHSSQQKNNPTTIIIMKIFVFRLINMLQVTSVDPNIAGFFP